jgi:hypothetical protein
MNARQFALPFRPKRLDPEDDRNADLIGRSYEDGAATITVTETCLNDQSRVMVERDLDGHVWSMPAWLMRLIFKEAKQKRAA